MKSLYRRITQTAVAAGLCGILAGCVEDTIFESEALRDKRWEERQRISKAERIRNGTFHREDVDSYELYKRFMDRRNKKEKEDKETPLFAKLLGHKYDKEHFEKRVPNKYKVWEKRYYDEKREEYEAKHKNDKQSYKIPRGIIENKDELEIMGSLEVGIRDRKAKYVDTYIEYKTFMDELYEEQIKDESKSKIEKLVKISRYDEYFNTRFPDEFKEWYPKYMEHRKNR